MHMYMYIVHVSTCTYMYVPLINFLKDVLKTSIVLLEDGVLGAEGKEWHGIHPYTYYRLVSCTIVHEHVHIRIHVHVHV